MRLVPLLRDILASKPELMHTITEEFWTEVLKLKLIYDRQSVGQSALVSGAHLGPMTNFSFSSKFPLDSCVFVIL
jgi:hypothetical protein